MTSDPEENVGPFETVLVGTDGSPSARAAEDVAALLGQAAGRRLLIVSAYEGDAEARAAAEAVLEQSRYRPGTSGLDVRTIAVKGDVADALIKTAERAGAEIVVVGDVGMGRARRLGIGGVPDRISHSAPCSVLIVRTSKSRDQPAGQGRVRGQYSSLLIATDGSSTAMHAAHVGAALAAALGAKLTLAHVGDELMGRIVLKDTAERLGDPELPQRVVTGEPGRAIADVAEELGSDLVIVGNKGMAGAKRVLGSVPNTVSHTADCDVLIVNTVGRSLAELKPGEGAIVDHSGRKIAAYHDESGQIFALSTKCTHLGCAVQWNTAHKSWDCPCHGSRFDAYGKVIQGPAQRDLEPIQAEQRPKSRS